jgi:hypothetical protein
MGQQEMMAKVIRNKCQPETGASTGNPYICSAAMKIILFHTVLAYVKICTLFLIRNSIFAA